MKPELLKGVIGGCVETTTGIIRLRAMERDGVLKDPMIAVNDNKTKHLLDNYYGTGQSTIDGILRASNILFAGKNVVVCGYGDCRKGVAMRAKGMGCKVIVTEVDEIRALEAAMDGFSVMTMSEAAKVGDVFVTTTGNKDIIRAEHMKAMKHGALLSNAGHFDNEIEKAFLERFKKKKIRENVEEFDLGGKKLYLLADGSGIASWMKNSMILFPFAC